MDDDFSCHAGVDIALVAERACGGECVFKAFAWIEDFVECALGAGGGDGVLCCAVVCPDDFVSLFDGEVCWFVGEVFDVDVVVAGYVSCFKFDV